MSVHYRIAETILEFTFTGSTRNHDIYEVFHNAFEDPECPRKAAVLIDNRLSTSRDQRGPEGAKAYARFFLEHPKRPEFTRVAVLLPEAAIPEFGAVVDEMSRSGGVSMRAFSDEPAARVWLDDGQG